MLQALTRYVEINSALVIGTDLFAGTIPQTASNNVALLMERGGPPDFYSAGMIALQLQLFSRGDTYWLARAKSYAVYNVLQGATGITLPVVQSAEEWLLNTAAASVLPQFLGLDELNRFEFSSNFTLEMERITW